MREWGGLPMRPPVPPRRGDLPRAAEARVGDTGEVTRPSPRLPLPRARSTPLNRAEAAMNRPRVLGSAADRFERRSPAPRRAVPIAPSARVRAPIGARTMELAKARARLASEKEKSRTLQTELVASARRQSELVAEARVREIRQRTICHRLLAALEEERLRISRDLHDAIGQTLTGINVGLATLKQESTSNSRDLNEALARTQRLVERSMKTVHQFAWELRPTLLDDLGLVPALRSYATTFSQRTGIAVRFAADPQCDRLDKDRAVALFRVAQGALSNVERHARAPGVHLVLRALPGAVRLEVTDNGRSFDVRRMESAKGATHLGPLVMRERVEIVAGTLSITSQRGRGTTVRAEVPLDATGSTGSAS